MKAFDSVWNHAKGPAGAVFESACPEIMDRAFVTHCAQHFSEGHT